MKRPYRLEKEGARFDVPTYATEHAARMAASKVTPGKKWKIVLRKGRNERETIMEGQNR